MRGHLCLELRIDCGCCGGRGGLGSERSFEAANQLGILLCNKRMT